MAKIYNFYENAINKTKYETITVIMIGIILFRY